MVNSRSAVAHAATHAPDLVFLDLPPGHPEGIGILRRLRAPLRQRLLPAVVLAQESEAELRARGVEFGPCDYPVRIGPVRSLSDPWPLSA